MFYKHLVYRVYRIALTVGTIRLTVFIENDKNLSVQIARKTVSRRIGREIKGVLYVLLLCRSHVPFLFPRRNATVCRIVLPVFLFW